MIDFQATRKAYKNLEMSDIGPMPTKNNQADWITKSKSCHPSTPLLTTAVMDHPINQRLTKNYKSVFVYKNIEEN